MQKLLKGRGHKVLSLWFAQQPFDGRAGMKLDISQPLEIGLAILHGQKWRGVSSKPLLAGLSCIAKSPNDRNPCPLQLFGLFCQVSRKHMGELVNSYRFRQLGVPVFLPARIAVSGLENLGLGTNSKRNHIANQQSSPVNSETLQPR